MVGFEFVGVFLCGCGMCDIGTLCRVWREGRRDVLPSFRGRERAPCRVAIGDKEGSEGEISHIIESLYLC